MASPWTFTERIAAYRAEGITDIVIMPGAATYNRDDETGKAFGPVYGVTIHHTAGVGPGMKNVIYNGVSGLPGPLAQDFLAKDGTLYVVGHGRCNHAGSITPAVRDAIIDEDAPGNQRDIGSETVDGNDMLYGLEIENEGNGDDPYPARQYDVAVRWAAAHLRHNGWGVNSAWGHKEITRRKIDPSFNMNTFRDRVHARLTSSEEENVALTTDDINKVAAAVVANLTGTASGKEKLVSAVFGTDDVVRSPDDTTSENKFWTSGTYLRETYLRAREVKAEAEALKARMDALAVGGVDLDALAVKVADELYRRMQS